MGKAIFPELSNFGSPPAEPGGYFFKIKTQHGTKGADVAWASDQRLEQIKDEAECSVAPEICIEVMSAANTEEEMLEKRNLYCDNGAEECWLCDQKGQFRFFSPVHEIAHSLLLPAFPRMLR